MQALRFGKNEQTMSALPAPNPKETAVHTKHNESRPKCKLRTRQEMHDSMRAGGWYRSNNEDLAQKIRLTSGNICTLMIDIFFCNLGRQYRGKGPEPKETTPFKVDELAIYLNVDRKAINNVLAYLKDRKMVTVSRLTGGRFIVLLHNELWPSIEDDYETWKKKQPLRVPQVEEEESTNDSVDSAIAVKPGIVPITRKPERVAAGCRSRAYAIKTGVRDYELDLSESPIDIEMSAAVISGRFVVKCVGQVETLRSKGNAKREKSNTYGDSPGSTVPGNTKIPPNVGRRTTTQVEVQHPRAEELSSLFDPLLLKSCGKSLSGDPQMLLAACEAIAEVPHDYLVKCVIDRAERPLKVSHVKALCKEVAYNFEAGKKIPPKSTKAPLTDPSKIIPWDPYSLVKKEKKA